MPVTLLVVLLSLCFLLCVGSLSTCVALHPPRRPHEQDLPLLHHLPQQQHHLISFRHLPLHGHRLWFILLSVFQLFPKLLLPKPFYLLTSGQQQQQQAVVSNSWLRLAPSTSCRSSAHLPATRPPPFLRQSRALSLLPDTHRSTINMVLFGLHVTRDGPSKPSVRLAVPLRTGTAVIIIVLYLFSSIGAICF